MKLVNSKDGMAVSRVVLDRLLICRFSNTYISILSNTLYVLYACFVYNETKMNVFEREQVLV